MCLFSLLYQPMNGICTPLNEFRKRTICRIPLFPLLTATSLSGISAYLSRHNTWSLVPHLRPPARHLREPRPGAGQQPPPPPAPGHTPRIWPASELRSCYIKSQDSSFTIVSNSDGGSRLVLIFQAAGRDCDQETSRPLLLELNVSFTRVIQLQEASQGGEVSVCSVSRSTTGQQTIGHM